MSTKERKNQTRKLKKTTKWKHENPEQFVYIDDCKKWIRFKCTYDSIFVSFFTIREFHLQFKQTKNYRTTDTERKNANNLSKSKARLILQLNFCRNLKAVQLSDAAASNYVNVIYCKNQPIAWKVLYKNQLWSNWMVFVIPLGNPNEK